MVVAVAVVLVMQMAFDKIVDVIPMGDRFMTAICAVHVLRIVAVAIVTLRAVGGVGGIDVKVVLVDMPLMRMVKVTVVEVVGVAVVLDRGVAALGAVLMVVVVVRDVILCHGVLLKLVQCRREVGGGMVEVLSGMIQAVGDETAGVLVGERVHDVLAFTLAAHYVFCPQHA